jgi:hypothetical protein
LAGLSTERSNVVVADDVVRLAYDEARAALREQDATLSSVRNRATGLLAAAVVGTSLSASVGLLNLDADRGRPFPEWAGWTLLATVVLISAGVMVVLWPTPTWTFGPSPRRLLDSAGEPIDTVLGAATAAMVTGIAANVRLLDRRVAAYRATVIVLALEISFLVLALLVTRE